MDNKVQRATGIMSKLTLHSKRQKASHKKDIPVCASPFFKRNLTVVAIVLN